MDSRNNLLIKNTVAQYVRMVVSVLVNLWTTRIILNQLGVDDYGIYSVIAGFVTLFGILNSSMVVSIQRYLSAGIKDEEKVKSIYNNAVIIHLFLALVLVVLLETVGRYFVVNYMTFPAGKLNDAVFVFHCVVVTFVLNVISIPQQAALVAFEKIYLSSLVGIVEVFLKLGIAFALIWKETDKLIFYASLLVVVLFVIRLLYALTVRFSIGLHFKWKIESASLKQLMGFAGWNLFGGVANLGKIQGVNVLLNMFFGTALNAAYGIANQVNSQILFVANSIFQSSNSQLIQSYVNEDSVRLDALVCKSAKFAFVMFFILTLPLYVCADELLTLWLGSVPDFCVLFLRLMLLNSYIELFSNPLMLLMQASGKIKAYFLVISSVMIMILPVSYVFLKQGFPATSVLVVTILINVFLLWIRILFVQKIAHYSCRKYVFRVLLPAFGIVLGALFVFGFLHCVLHTGAWLTIGVVVAADILLVGALCYRCFLSFSERQFVRQMFVNVLHRFHV